MARPITDAQRAAYQRNAQKSTGPRTDAGKATSRLNALKHGLTAKLPLLPFEDPADFETLKNGFLQDFAPKNTYQRFLATQLATEAGRIMRSQQVEVGLQEVLMKKIVHDLKKRGLDADQALCDNPYAGLALTLEPPANDPHNHLLRNFFRYAREIQFAFHRTRKALLEAMREKDINPIESKTPRFAPSPEPAPVPTAPSPRPQPGDNTATATSRTPPLPFAGHPRKS